jgi:DNA-binding MurR/RpiR family transcriptional regulator
MPGTPRRCVFGNQYQGKARNIRLLPRLPARPRAGVVVLTGAAESPLSELADVPFTLPPAHRSGAGEHMPCITPCAICSSAASLGAAIENELDSD